MKRSTRVAAAISCAWLLACGHAAADVKISGSETLEPYFLDAVSQFSRGPGAGVPVATVFKGSIAGLKDLCEGRANVAPSSAKIDTDSARRCESSRTAIVELPIAFDAIVVIAHPSRAGIGELNMSDLKTIFAPDSASKVTRWSQVRPTFADAPLTVVSLDPRSGTNAFFSAKVHGLRGFVRVDAKVSTDHREVIKMVAADPGAIGFVSMGALAESKIAVWKVPLNFGNGPVVPSREAVLNDSYATMSRLLYVYASQASLTAADGHTKQFLSWLMERGGKLAAYEGFVPLVDQNYQDNLRRIAAPK